MKTVTRRGIAQLCALLAGTLVAGCLRPTRPPFPPPAEPKTMTYVAPGQLRLQGVLTHEKATVFAINSETGEIGGRVIKDGTYAFTVPAQPMQEIELFFQVGFDASESTFFKAPPLDIVGEPDAGLPSDGSSTGSSTADSASPDSLEAQSL
jgi:hypothetical protein